MKMTRLEWRYLQRLALDHPYYDTHKPPLGDAEARAIMEANNTMTGREFVDCIYAKLGMKRPEKKKERFSWLRNIGELFTVPPIRKIAIAALVVLLMAVFFAATPTGRAIAESAIHYVVRLFENEIILEPDQTEGQAVERLDQFDANMLNGIKTETADMKIVSMDQFTALTGKTPFTLPFELCSAEYGDFEGLCLATEYQTPKGFISVIQVWDNENALITVTDSMYCRYADTSVYYTEETDGSITCMKVLPDSVIYAHADKSVESETVLNSLNP